MPYRVRTRRRSAAGRLGGAFDTHACAFVSRTNKAGVQTASGWVSGALPDVWHGAASARAASAAAITSDPAERGRRVEQQALDLVPVAEPFGVLLDRAGKVPVGVAFGRGLPIREHLGHLHEVHRVNAAAV